MGTHKTEPKILSTTTPQEPLQRRAEKMTNKQLAAYLRKQKNSKNGELKEICRAIVYSLVLENTAATGLGGKLASALRG